MVNSRSLERAEEFGLHFVEQAAFGEWVQALQRLRLLERLDAVDCRQEESIRAVRVVLKRGDRIRPRAEALALQK